jgi:bifunctional non-homologous end joining protein LigD
MQLPIIPMAPISHDDIPLGEDWCYQLKWDGVRIIAQLNDDTVSLYSRNGLMKNKTYPELARNLAKLSKRMVLDGEAVVFDPIMQRPSFPMILQRERLKVTNRIEGAVQTHHITYVLFDLIELDGVDLRNLPYQERYERLKLVFPAKENWLLVTDLFLDGELLWHWVESNSWEGMVSKRLSSLYREGKHHKDWLKKKTKQKFEASIVGMTFKEGQLLSSLIMTIDGQYAGRVSGGLNESLKHRLLQLPNHAVSPFLKIPADLNNVKLEWLKQPFHAIVSGQEMSEYGLIRHPQIVKLELE